MRKQLLERLRCAHTAKWVNEPAGKLCVAVLAGVVRVCLAVAKCLESWNWELKVKIAGGLFDVDHPLSAHEV
jgi:hypothetical protein